MSKSNPEARLQASVQRDIKIRLLNEAAKKQADHLAIARWDNNLSIKDKLAEKKRNEAALINDGILSNLAVKAARKVKLEELYAADEIKYRNELSMKGLSFRKI